MMRNLVYSLAGAGSSLLLFVLFLLAARVLGDGVFGLFSWALAFVFLFEYLTDFGVSDIATREVARDSRRARVYLANLLGYRTLLALLVYAAIALAVVVVTDDPRAARLVWILGGSIVLRTFLNSSRCFYRAFERFDLDALAITVDRGLLLAGGAAALWLTGSPEALAWSFVGVRLVSVAVNAVLLRRLMAFPRPALDWRFVRAMQLEALAIGGFHVVIGAATYIDAIMLGFWRSYEEIGWYSAAYRIYLGIAMVAPLVVLAFTPRLARLALQEPRVAHRALTDGLFRLYWPAGCGVTLLGVAGAPLLVQLAYGAEYAPAVPALQILMAGLVLLFTSVLCTQVLISIDRQSRTFPIVAAGLALNVALNLLVIPRWGYLGAAGATVAAEVLIAVLFLRAAWRDSSWRPATRDLLRPLPGTLAGVAVLLVPGLPLAVGLVLAGAAFLAGLAALGVPSDEERRWLTDRLRRRRAPALAPGGVARRQP